MGMGLSGRTLSSGCWARDSRISNHVWPVAEEEFKQSTISLKKAGVVYDLTEIDNGRIFRLIGFCGILHKGRQFA
jgi:hypothetical protein